MQHRSVDEPFSPYSIQRSLEGMMAAVDDPAGTSRAVTSAITAES